MEGKKRGNVLDKVHHDQMKMFNLTLFLYIFVNISPLRIIHRIFQYELATGRFPYPKWNSVFDQLTQVVRGDPPQLSNSEERRFSPKFIAFVNVW